MTKQLCAVGILALLGGTAAAQRPPQGGVGPQIERCLHDRAETAAEQARREEAVAAMRMIDYVLYGSPRVFKEKRWADFGRESMVDVLRGRADAIGDLARTIVWGADEPLPGWRMTWGWSGRRAVYSLTDQRDPCAFRLLSDDPDVIPGPKGELKVLPLEHY